jgi:hypothetical protein
MLHGASTKLRKWKLATFRMCREMEISVVLFEQARVRELRRMRLLLQVPGMLLQASKFYLLPHFLPLQSAVLLAAGSQSILSSDAAPNISVQRFRDLYKTPNQYQPPGLNNRPPTQPSQKTTSERPLVSNSVQPFRTNRYSPYLQRLSLQIALQIETHPRTHTKTQKLRIMTYISAIGTPAARTAHQYT